MSRWYRWLWDIPRQLAWAPWLIAANLGGAAYGIYWYWPQLQATPWWYWPVVPDSPLSNLLFAGFLVGWYYRKAPPFLAALAVWGMIKYGGWTVVVFGQMYLSGLSLSPLDWWLMLSHLAMLGEALLFARHLRLPLRALLGPGVWYVANDCFDYVLGFHPALPVPELFSTVAGMALVLTVLGGLVLWGWSGRGRPGNETQTSYQH